MSGLAVIVAAGGGFKQVLVEYQKAPAVTRERMYLETMQQIFANTAKVMIDVPQGKKPKAVNLSSPDNPTPDLQKLAFVDQHDSITFNVAVKQYSLVVVSWQSA